MRLSANEVMFADLPKISKVCLLRMVCASVRSVVLMIIPFLVGLSSLIAVRGTYFRN